MYGSPSAAGARTRPTSPATAKIVARYGSIARNADGIVTGVPMMVRTVCSASANPNSSAAATAPRGLHRPKMTAARAMNPLPELMFLLNPPTRADREERAAEAGDEAGGDHVDVAGPQHLDADRVGGPGVLADGPGAQAPAGAEQRDVHADDQRRTSCRR